MSIILIDKLLICINAAYMNEDDSVQQRSTNPVVTSHQRSTNPVVATLDV